MDDVCHLHELEVIFKRCVTFSCILMLHAIPSIFECIEALILNFPSQAPGFTGVGNVTGIDW